jgi:hypothetical protein
MKTQPTYSVGQRITQTYWATQTNSKQTLRGTITAVKPTPEGVRLDVRTDNGESRSLTISGETVRVTSQAKGETSTRQDLGRGTL